MSYAEACAAGGLAVVTGGASGVGFAAAQRFAAQGLDLLIADLPGDALDTAAAELAAEFPDRSVTPVACDVRDAGQVQALADQAFAAGPVAVLMNNAGINIPSSCLDQMENWESLMDVNFMGILRGVQAFVPRMVAAGRPAVVINTGSKQGITTPPGNPAYNAAKAAVKVLSEQLAHELRAAGAPISVHLFVPGFTYTGMVSARVLEKPASAWTSEQTVEYFLGRMGQGDFYILCPDNDVDETRDRRRAEWALGDVIENRPALSRWHPDYKDAFAAFEKTGERPR